jgi:dephospho-CoA kinase
MVIGLTGPNASGKGEVALYLKSKGFSYYSLSDILREEGRRLGIEPLRENLIKLGNDLRRKNGSSYLAQKVIERLPKSGDHIVDSIRNPTEVKTLSNIDDFVLIGIDAPVKIRFERSLKRKRLGDAKTLQEFIKKEKRENKNDTENQQLNKCLRLANVIIVNNSTIQELYRKIDEAIEKNKKA